MFNNCLREKESGKLFKIGDDERIIPFEFLPSFKHFIRSPLFLCIVIGSSQIMNLVLFGRKSTLLVFAAFILLTVKLLIGKWKTLIGP